MAYNPSTLVTYFHGLPRPGGGDNVFQPPSTYDLLAAARSDPYYRSALSTSAALFVVGAVLGVLLYAFQLNLYLCRRRCCLCSRAPFMRLAVILLLLCGLSAVLAAAELGSFAALAKGVGAVQGSLVGVVAALQGMSTVASGLQGTLATVAVAGRSVLDSNATLAATACAGLPNPPCTTVSISTFNTLLCPPVNPYADCAASLAPLAASAAAASDAASASASLLSTGLAAFTASISLLSTNLASVPWDAVRAGITSAGNALTGLTVATCALQAAVACFTRGTLAAKRAHACLGVLGVALMALLFALAAFLYAGALVASDFCYAPFEALGRVTAASAAGGGGAATPASTAAVASTLAFIASCQLTSSPSVGNTTALGALQLSASGMAAAASFNSLWAGLPASVQGALPPPVTALAGALSLSTNGLSALAQGLACAQVNALLAPVLNSVCWDSTGAIITLAQLLVAGSLFMLAQQWGAFCVAENAASGGGGGVLASGGGAAAGGELGPAGADTGRGVFFAPQKLSPLKVVTPVWHASNPVGVVKPAAAAAEPRAGPYSSHVPSYSSSV